MTRRTIKQEKPSEEVFKDVGMSPSTRLKRSSRVEPRDGDTDMAETPITSANEFPAMPTPATSFGGDNMNEIATNGQRRLSVTGMQYLRSSAPSAESSLHIVGRRVQVLVDAIHDFREFGVDHVVQLPELVLVGDQSAGKSSLMGALAEINLPQSTGCCTRCPAHVKTAPAEVWSCKISLQQFYSYEPLNGRPLDPKDVTRNRPFPPWKEQQLVVKPFKTIMDKKQLEEVLRWAQIATLNHNSNHALYIPGTDNFRGDSRTEAKFSPNVVSVEISGPGLVPLSFYDLPGIFQNAGQKEDQYLVKVIENLAAKYVRHPQALIICALPMSADPATSRTAKVIADLNAESRCIGVLTKADQLQDGQAHTDFESMLRGHEHVIGHGYYVTKLPGQPLARYDGEYHSKARTAEELFFSSQSPWDSEWREFQDRFGTSNLAHALSQKFAAQIVESIPDIERKIFLRAQEIDAQLLSLPELPSKNILHVVFQNLSAFSTKVQKLLDGGGSQNEFQSSWCKLCEQFRETILAMRPMITITDLSDMDLPDVINIDDDDEDMNMSDVPSSTNGRKRLNDETPSPSDKKAKFDPSTPSGSRTGQANAPDFFWTTNGTPKTNGANSLPYRQGTPNPTSPILAKRVVDEVPNPFVKFLGAGKNFATIGEIRRMISRHSRTGLPGIVNDQVYTEMCIQSVTPWVDPLEMMLDITLKMLRSQTDEILLSILSKWQQTQLFKQARQHLSKFFDEFETSQRAAATELYKLETYRLFTVNHLTMEEYRQQELVTLRRARRAKRVRAYVEKEARMTRKPFKDPASRKAAEDRIKDEQLGKDPFQTEVEVAAYVRGYYMTAALRFVDSVCLSIHGKLFRDAQKKIFYFLEQQLGLNTGNGETRCRELMEENTAVAARRAQLRTEQENLERFTERLRQLALDNAALDQADAETEET